MLVAACGFEHGRLPEGTGGGGGTDIDANGVTNTDARKLDAPGAAPACWTASGYSAAPSGRKYRAPHSDATWTGAQSQCASTGGHLVVINDGAENAHVQSIMDQNSWIGLSDHAQEGTFAWANGEALSFTSWAPSEPQNSSGATCLYIMPDGKWAAGSCGSMEYVCECPYP